MKKSLIASVFLLFAVFGACKAQVSFNGDFEEIDPKTKLPTGWTEFMASGYNFGLDNTTAKKGKSSLSVVSKAPNARYFGISRVIPQIFAGSKLQLKGFIKTENVSGFAGLYMGIDGTNTFDDMKKQNIKGTTDWTEYTIELPYDEKNAEQINIGTKLEGTGKVWFDDVRVYIDGRPIEEAVIKSNGFKAKQDKEFDRSSGITYIADNKLTVDKLALLAQVWGFIKYHLPTVANGDHNMDAELFRVMPAVLKAADVKQANDAIEQWVDKLGAPAACRNCKPKIKGNVVIEPNYGDLFNEKVVSESLRAKLKYILDNSNITQSYYIAMGGAGNPTFKHETEYAQSVYNDPGFRILCLFRYWNMVQYFAPYRDVIGRDWKSVLNEYIAKYTIVKDDTDYGMVTLSLFVNLNDSHAILRNNLNGVNRFFGTLMPPVSVTFIDDKLVVNGFYGDTLNVKSNFKIGDVINVINGSTVDHLVKVRLPFTAGSNYPTKLRNLAYTIARTNEGVSTYQVTRDGKPVTVQQQNLPLYQVNYTALNPAPNDGKGFKLINEDIGYLYPGAYYNKDLPAIKAMFDKTKAIIIDFRCYPSDNMPFTFVPYVKNKRSDFSRFTFGSINRPGTFVMGEPLANQGSGGYKGKVIVIVNERAQSAAEFTTMALQSSPNVTVIGSTTAGADGNVSPITLPGGISTYISGIGVFYPDKTPTQRVGVKIDMVVKPTIEGLKAGRDELMEKAMELASK